MSIALIVAMDRKRLIGRNGDLPWRLPDDLKHFKALTLNKIVLMGRKTWDSLGRPLPQRENWVLSRDAAFAPPGARVFADLATALAAAQGRELMVIGGAQLYAQTLALADTLYLTEVEADVDGGDAWFPEFERSAWQETQRQAHPADERHAYAFTFLTLRRGQSGAP
ncbi:dihydrofolate reductase [Solimonas aquatica]|uniref:Dihydrofolate reductase n=1 Tax=Solimonas aquatica TaxID=489703 RepID=A0A1H9CF33_9GAMM|nr:dihydrofolate reductase [Solimonas aquatica]SEP99627.1 dihydrofolate reductase [Solimonas aquatica]